MAKNKNESLEDDHLPSYRIRPKFEISTLLTPLELQKKIQIGLESNNAPVKGWVTEHYASLFLPKEEQHYWSPFLSLSFEEEDVHDYLKEESNNHDTILSGRYGPRPSVWTMFIFFYTILGLGATIISIIGFANRSVGKSSAILWLVPVLLLLFLTFFLVAYYGQKLGHDQMVVLHQFLEKCTGLDIDAKHPDKVSNNNSI